MREKGVVQWFNSAKGYMGWRNKYIITVGTLDEAMFQSDPHRDFTLGGQFDGITNQVQKDLTGARDLQIRSAGASSSIS